MRSGDFDTIDKWLATRPNPRKKSDEHHVEQRRIRDQWRNYRKQLKSGMSVNGGRIPQGWLDKQYREQGGHCAICDTPLGEDNFHIDHIIPVSHGGPNEGRNLQLTHSLCNEKKNNNLFVFMGQY